MESVSTIAVQFKIVAAVRATEMKDIESEKQLVVVSQSLTKSVESLLKNCEVASIRALRNNGGSYSDALARFRKLLFSNKVDGSTSNLKNGSTRSLTQLGVKH
jgi:hypothetical protein